MPTLSEDLAFRGLIHQVTDPELPKRFDQPGLTVYAGFDPSADSLHVGNLVPLLGLRRFQLLGHHPIALAGGATGSIGDPSGKTQERQLLTKEVLDHNIASVKEQIKQQLLQTKKTDKMTKWLDDVKKNFAKTVSYQAGYAPATTATTSTTTASTTG